MIMLSSKNKVDCQQYDHVWYCTTTCPGMRQGCEHHPELAGSRELHALWYKGGFSEEELYAMYVKEMSTSDKLLNLLEVIRRSDNGEWFQLIFYENDKNDGERKYLYDIIKKYTDNVYIE